MVQAEIAKLILSNRLLKDGTLCFACIIPFDVPVDSTVCQVWWRQRDIQPNFLLQFPNTILEKLTEILGTCGSTLSALNVNPLVSKGPQNPCGPWRRFQDQFFCGEELPEKPSNRFEGVVR